MVSIIVPVYNMEKYVIECIESLINQTFEDIEIILVDDGSTDNSGKICDTYLQKDERVQVYHINNSGPSFARNFGVKKSKGEYIMFVDADDWIDIDTIEICLKDAKNSDIVLFNMCDFIETIIQKYLVFEGETRYFTANEMGYIEEILLVNKTEYGGSAISLTGSYCKLYKKTVLETCVFPEDIISGEDACFVAQVLRNAKTLAYTNHVFYHRRILKDSLSHFQRKDYGDRRLKYVNWILNFYEGKKPWKILNLFCFENYFLVENYFLNLKNTSYLEKKKLINEFKKGINFEYNFNAITLKKEKCNGYLLRKLIIKDQMLLASAVLRLAALKNKLRMQS